ncbi:hypothetical protein ACWF0M_00455 [Kribbella sp. NPDC055110]
MGEARDQGADDCGDHGGRRRRVPGERAAEHDKRTGDRGQLRPREPPVGSTIGVQPQQQPKDPVRTVEYSEDLSAEHPDGT